MANRIGMIRSDVVNERKKISKISEEIDAFKEVKVQKRVVKRRLTGK